MAWMLDVLDVREDLRVLEIGTGTGYNAGILSRRLGDDRVTTIDIDSALVNEARTRLAALGYHPTLVVGDGREGYSTKAPYDRIIATCSLPRVPYAWVKQTRPNGRILLNVSGTLGGAMLLVRVANDGTAVGRFPSRHAGFLPARGASGVDEITPKDTADGAYVTDVTSLSPELLDRPDFAFLAWLATRDARLYWADLDDGRRLTCLLGLDGSWCEVYPPDADGRRVDQGGPRRLWRLVEEAYDFWRGHAQPGWTRFGVAITPAEQRVWLDGPSYPTPWRLPTGC